VKLLQEGEAMLSAGKSAAEVSHKREISEATRVRGKKQFGGVDSEEARRLRDLAIENQKFKEMLAEAELGGLTPAAFASRCAAFTSVAAIPSLQQHSTLIYFPTPYPHIAASKNGAFHRVCVR
jgi:hypothetical protein